ncbi:uncharacterized protein LOC108673813 isoform X2 [Hyalella azteca]|uniref:Uncharacterized protein LOC108673813 isoform X2 n=1 Tax=Hyalella azteca TaxID=294128 RepID=A0A8B7NW77_HYAAZ|nr:uncharacterized protein LOC108673813 isoform X2 [Hyalella azteca]
MEEQSSMIVIKDCYVSLCDIGIFGDLSGRIVLEEEGDESKNESFGVVDSTSIDGPLTIGKDSPAHHVPTIGQDSITSDYVDPTLTATEGSTATSISDLVLKIKKTLNELSTFADEQSDKRSRKVIRRCKQALEYIEKNDKIYKNILPGIGLQVNDLREKSSLINFKTKKFDKETLSSFEEDDDILTNNCGNWCDGLDNADSADDILKISSQSAVTAFHDRVKYHEEYISPLLDNCQDFESSNEFDMFAELPHPSAFLGFDPITHCDADEELSLSYDTLHNNTDNTSLLEFDYQDLKDCKTGDYSYLPLSSWEQLGSRTPSEAIAEDITTLMMDKRTPILKAEEPAKLLDNDAKYICQHCDFEVPYTVGNMTAIVQHLLPLRKFTQKSVDNILKQVLVCRLELRQEFSDGLKVQVASTLVCKLCSKKFEVYCEHLYKVAHHLNCCAMKAYGVSPFCIFCCESVAAGCMDQHFDQRSPQSCAAAWMKMAEIIPIGCKKVTQDLRTRCKLCKAVFSPYDCIPLDDKAFCTTCHKNLTTANILAVDSDSQQNCRLCDSSCSQKFITLADPQIRVGSHCWISLRFSEKVIKTRDHCLAYRSLTRLLGSTYKIVSKEYFNNGVKNTLPQFPFPCMK